MAEPHYLLGGGATVPASGSGVDDLVASGAS